MDKSKSHPNRTGRPLSFDRGAALKVAMHLFWQHGFEATSIAELTHAMRITPPSLYAAFGDKRRLFMETVDLYLGGVDTVTKGIDAATTARDAARELLTAAAIGHTGEDTPRGCLLASAIVSSSTRADDIREELADIRRHIEAALRSRIERDIRAGILPANADADMLAGHVFAVIQGMSTLAKDGANRDKLLRIVHGTMLGWPDSN
ncbi:Bacterial regulatory proteins%2C tetR family [Yersinia intermedia]|uniref:Bacterial regulatory proteins, tetR family n=3 Tax=Yersinia intermedia TaxID=631 RepID=A0A0T9N2U6_YERIN|nr:TetR/AcrR family transcriptional regulator [Yersinia intermedia]AJJ21046.1 bacterial regulatory s, tetR family protein [Yersinia intermedia]CNG73218.1 Bacterial regulatory proteins%2C tetR family [Yersinia intermedia]CNH46774.1 Bacterial regulatory proteins%2C tetR family [Yersinia intermedia]CNK39477.1 Bacterial regulatory proteins%2C tetR family [Yersinia intermedia]